MRNLTTIDLFFFSLRYEGFLVDMLEELSTMLGFTFTIHENPRKSFGIDTEGMIYEVMILSFRYASWVMLVGDNRTMTASTEHTRGTGKLYFTKTNRQIMMRFCDDVISHQICLV